MTSEVRKLPAGFGRLWIAQSVSSLGDGVTYAALPLLALTLTRDPMMLAVVTATGTLPWLLFGVLGGALADRWDRRRTMRVADAARAVLLAIPAAAAALDVLSIPLLAAAAFLLGLGGLFFDTAVTAYLLDLLGRDPALLERANSRLRGTQTAASGFAGPPAGSALLVLGRAVPLLADAVSFAFSALLVRSLPAAPRTGGPRFAAPAGAGRGLVRLPGSAAARARAPSGGRERRFPGRLAGHHVRPARSALRRRRHPAHHDRRHRDHDQQPPGRGGAA
ncbi:MAG TPA: MFS transporter [Streptosporangiaceae bacterium]|nr:MFS transporter [Streptosporangiaceae bacterium]